MDRSKTAPGVMIRGSALAMLAGGLVMTCLAQVGLPPSPERAADGPTGTVVALESDHPEEERWWNWHVQNTEIVQYHPRFSASYSGPNSLPQFNEVKETVSLDLLAGLRLWRGAEVQIDGLVWQGFGLGNTRGIEGFPNGEAFRLGTKVPNVNVSRLFVRQVIDLGDEQEQVEDEGRYLGGHRAISRLTVTVGKMSVKDVFDNNAYANDPQTQFMNWSLMANSAWDYPADALGYIPGLALELNQPVWALRYGLFAMPRSANGVALDPDYLGAWGLVTELERRYGWRGHPGAVRLLAFLNQADMGSYQAALDRPERPADIRATRADRDKWGFGLNLEQELTPGLGAFARLGWSDGRNEGWAFNDVDRTVSLGLSVKGRWWQRPADTIGLAWVMNGASAVHRQFLAAGGVGILAGDGTLSYGWEQIFETYYDYALWKTVHAAVDYQFINHPAFNRDRGPVSVFGARLHWEF